MARTKKFSKPARNRDEKPFRADFIVYLGGTSSIKTITISATNREVAWRKAQRMTTSIQHFPLSAVVRIPKDNVCPIQQ